MRGEVGEVEGGREEVEGGI
jgi:hypothetical protein